MLGKPEWRVGVKADEKVLAREGIRRFREAEPKDRRPDVATTLRTVGPVSPGLRQARLVERAAPVDAGHLGLLPDASPVGHRPPVTEAGRAVCVGSHRVASIEMRQLRGRVW